MNSLPFHRVVIILIVILSLFSCNTPFFYEIDTPPELSVNEPCGTSYTDTAKIFGDELEINWTTVTGAETYEIHINGESVEDDADQILRFDYTDATDGLILTVPEHLKFHVPLQIVVYAVNDFQKEKSLQTCYVTMIDPTPKNLLPASDVCAQNNPMFSFDGIRFLEYTLSIYDHTGTLIEPVYQTSDLTQTDDSFALPISLPAGTYSFTVQPISFDTKYAATEEFSIDATSVEPANLLDNTTGCNSDTVSLTWDMQSFGDYEVESDYSGSFTSEGITLSSEGATWQAAHHGTVTWRVRHSNGTCDPTDWVTATFDVFNSADVTTALLFDKPEVCSGKELNLTWTPKTYGDYLVEINQDTLGENWTDTLFSTITDGQASMIVPLTWSGTYEARIQHSTACDTAPFSEYTFDVIQSPTTPTSVSIDNSNPPADIDVTITWDDVGYGSYTIVFDTVPETIFDDTGTSGTETIHIPLDWAGLIDWHVIHSNGSCTDAIADSTIDVQCPIITAPTLPASLSDLCDGDDAVVNWTSVSGDDYLVHFYDGSWGSPSYIAGNSSATKENVGIGTGYKWRIRTDRNGCLSDWEESGTFDVNGTPADVFDSAPDVCEGNNDAQLNLSSSTGISNVELNSNSASGSNPYSVNINGWTPNSYDWTYDRTVGGCSANYSHSTNVIDNATATPTTIPSGGPEPYGADLNWTGTGTNYSVQISDDGFTTTTWQNTNATGTSVSFSGLLQGTYEWRIQANDTCNDGWHTYSGTFDVTTGSPILIISEICDPKNDYSDNRYVEITNIGSATADLTGWTLEVWENKGHSSSEYDFTFNLSSQTLNAGESLLCVKTGFPSTGSYSGKMVTGAVDWTMFNGEYADGAILKNGAATIDYAIECDHGGGIDSHCNAAYYENAALIRDAGVTGPSTSFISGDWSPTATINDWSDSTPGSHP